MPDEKHKFDPEIAKLLKSVLDQFVKEDYDTRQRQVRHYQRLKLYWNNLSMIYWSATAKDYRIAAFDQGNDGDFQDYYNRPVNVYRAFLETIIAALSIQIPAVVCVPDDTENPDDISTAKGGNLISEKIYKENDVIFVWLNALYIYCTEGMIACHHYPEESEEYGTYEEKQYEDKEVESYVCPECGGQIEDDQFQSMTAGLESNLSPNDEELGGEEGTESIEIDELEDENKLACPHCDAPLQPGMQKAKLNIPNFVGTKTRGKVRICTDVYGGTYVRVANYAKKQKDTPFLLFEYETHYANAIEKYPKIREKLPKGSGQNVYDQYDANARLNPQYRGEMPENNVTMREGWLRPAAFNVLGDKESKKLKALFPTGVKLCLVNDIAAEYYKEALDDRWTLTVNPMSDFLTHEPLGELLTNIQDIVNDLISLTIQTIEHGILQTWADPSVVNFDGQSQLEATPGAYTPTKAAAGKNISDSFFQSQAATLSPEIFNFYRIVQELGQFVSGALPSLYGGNPGSGSSETASEYAMSKGMAMQRLQTPWRMMTVWWKTIFGKVIPQYMSEMVEDDKLVRKNEQGGFESILIRKAELNGKLGSVELEAADQVPITDEQKAEVILRLMELNNAEILRALSIPENLPMVRKIIKIPQFVLPGEKDRTKQLEEIDILITTQPLVFPTGVPDVPDIEIPSVEVDELIDNHQIEAEICRNWLIGDAGRLAKIENPLGYKNVMLHMKAHMDIIREQLMQQMMQQQQMIQDQRAANGSDNSGKQTGKQPNKPGKPSGDGAPVKGESDAQLPIR